MDISKKYKKFALILAIVLMICPYNYVAATPVLDDLDLGQVSLTPPHHDFSFDSEEVDIPEPTDEDPIPVEADALDEADEDIFTPSPISENRPVAQVEAHFIAEYVRYRDQGESEEVIALAKGIWNAKETSPAATSTKSGGFQLLSVEPDAFAEPGQAPTITLDWSVIEFLVLDDPFNVPHTEIQAMAHEIAEIERAAGYPEDDPVIISAQTIYAAEDAEREAEQAWRIQIAEDLHNLLYSGGVLPYEITYDPAYEQDAIDLGRTIGGENYGETNLDRLSAIAWEGIGRERAGYGPIYRIVRAENQYNFSETMPTKWTDIYGQNPVDTIELSRDVLFRAKLESLGIADVGRTLPEGYLWHRGDGHINTFRNAYDWPYAKWDWSLPSPYYTN